MRTFKDQLTKIEDILELLSNCNVRQWDWLHSELRDVLDAEAENIVQLAKVAKAMRESMTYNTKPTIDWASAREACEMYDKLLGPK